MLRKKATIVNAGAPTSWKAKRLNTRVKIANRGLEANNKSEGNLLRDLLGITKSVSGLRGPSSRGIVPGALAC